MQKNTISNDDLLDVMEMTKKLESYIYKTLKDNELNLAMSALMSAFINTILAQCDTLDDVMFYKNIFLQIFNSSVKNIKIQEK